jgi:hypothetical protein
MRCGTRLSCGQRRSCATLHRSTPQQASQRQRLQERIARQANQIGRRAGTNRTSGLRDVRELFEREGLG